MVDKSEIICNLSNWLASHDVDVSSVIVEHHESIEGCGIYAAKHLNNGESTLRIPLKYCMSVLSAKESDLALLMGTNWDNYAADEILALHLLIEWNKGAASQFSSYLQSLPLEFNTPLFWSDEELRLLEGTNVLTLTHMLDKQIREDYEKIQLPLLKHYVQLTGSSLQFMDLNWYRWALSIIWTRAFGFYIRGKYYRVLCPLLDMFNHNVLLSNPLDDFVSYDPALNVIQHRVIEKCEAKSPIYISYGPYSNAKLLYSYGFVSFEQNNPFTGIDLWVKVPSSDPHYEYKNHLLQANELTKEQTYDFTGTIHHGKIDERLLATIRVILLVQEEFEYAQKAFHAQIVSIRNEMSVYSTLKTLCNKRLEKFPETLEEDLLMRRQIDKNCQFRKACALQVRIEEKQILTSVVAMLERWNQLLVEDRTVYPPRTCH